MIELRDAFRAAMLSWKILLDTGELDEVFSKWEKVAEKGMDKETAERGLREPCSIVARNAHASLEINHQRPLTSEEKTRVNDAVEIVQEFIMYMGRDLGLWGEP